MSWEKQLGNISRRDRLKERAKQSWREQEGGYNKPPQKSKLGGRDKCKIETCYAVTCKYNYEKDCTLPTVTLSNKAVCQDFTPKGTELSTEE